MLLLHCPLFTAVAARSRLSLLHPVTSSTVCSSVAMKAHQVRVCVRSLYPIKNLELMNVVHSLRYQRQLGLQHESLYLESVKGLNYSISLVNDNPACFAGMIRNQTDFHPDAVRHARRMEDRYTDRMATLGQSSYHMLSTYEMKEEQQHQTSVLQFVYGFTSDIWLLITALLIISSIIMLVTSRRIQRHHRRSQRQTTSPLIEAWSWLTAVMMKQSGSLPQPVCLRRQRLLLLTQLTAAFLLTFYLTSMIKTASVTYGRPDIVDTIDDLKRYGVRPVFKARFYDYLKDAPEDSLLKRFVNLAQQIGMKKTRYATLVDTLNQVFRGKAAIVVANEGGNFIETNRAYFCQGMRIEMIGGFTRDRQLHRFTWISRDRDEHSHLLVVFKRRRMDAVAGSVIYRRLQWMVQHALTEHIDRQNFMTEYPHVYSKVGQEAGVRDCMSNEIHYPHNDDACMPLMHYLYLFAFMPLLMIVFPGPILLMEWLTRRLTDNMARRHYYKTPA